MFIDPMKYSTRCVDSGTGEVILEKDFEAINSSEAESRAFLNCSKISGKTKNLNVTVKRL